MAGRRGAEEAALRTIGRPAALPSRLLAEFALAVEAARRSDGPTTAEHLGALTEAGATMADTWSWIVALGGVGAALELGHTDLAARWLSGMRPSRLAAVQPEVFACRAVFGSDPRLAGRFGARAVMSKDELLAEVAAFESSLR
jgi:hypothetical protein